MSSAYSHNLTSSVCILWLTSWVSTLNIKDLPAVWHLFIGFLGTMLVHHEFWWCFLIRYRLWTWRSDFLHLELGAISLVLCFCLPHRKLVCSQWKLHMLFPLVLTGLRLYIGESVVLFGWLKPYCSLGITVIILLWIFSSNMLLSILNDANSKVIPQ